MSHCLPFLRHIHHGAPDNISLRVSLIPYRPSDFCGCHQEPGGSTIAIRVHSVPWWCLVVIITTIHTFYNSSFAYFTCHLGCIVIADGWDSGCCWWNANVHYMACSNFLGECETEYFSFFFLKDGYEFVRGALCH